MVSRWWRQKRCRLRRLLFQLVDAKFLAFRHNFLSFRCVGARPHVTQNFVFQRKIPGYWERTWFAFSAPIAGHDAP